MKGDILTGGTLSLSKPATCGGHSDRGLSFLVNQLHAGDILTGALSVLVNQLHAGDILTGDTS